jgi:ABC-type antimicrobial peptide transport system permease subunit
MLKNYLKIAFRNILKNRVYSFINIFGLATGMAVAMLIGLWMLDELSFNTCHDNYLHLGRIMTTWYNSEEPGTGEAVAIPLGEELRTKYAGDFKKVSMASWNFGHIIAYGEKKLSKQGMWAEHELPEMLSLKILKGNKNALQDPSSILLTESLAKALFDNEDPLNKTIRLDNSIDFKVAGIYQDLPRNANFAIVKFFIPWKKYVASQEWLTSAQTQWNNHSFQLFVQMQDNADFNKVSAKIKDVPMQHLKASVDGRESVSVHPMCDWHLYSDFKNGKSVGGRIQFVWLFGIIGVFVLLLACINFMNLSTARSEKRAKEVGVRKAIGSVKSQLIGQFLSESLLVVFMAFVLAVLLVQLNLPWFNQLSDKAMVVQWNNPMFWILGLGFTIITGLLAGSYPAFYLSSFEPVKVLKGTFRAGRFASIPRKALVVLQFTVSITLIIGTIIVFRQIQHAKNRPIGYNREGLISIPMNTPDIRGKYTAIREELLKTGAVENMAQSSSPLTNVWANQIGFDWKGKDPNSVPVFGTIAVTHDFGKTVSWEIKQGRSFAREFGTDTVALVLNEAAAKVVGFKNPVGETIKWNDKNYEIIGVIKDLVMESPFQPIKPTIFLLSYDWADVITVKLKPGMPIKDALAKVEPVFKKFNPGSPFDFQFIDEEYNKKFSSEARIGTLASVFAGLAILISCLGLFGLASFMAEQRTKEIGVRKVLGASVANLWLLLSKDFVRLVLISLLISIPIAYYFMNNWLQSYNYRSTLTWWIFAAAGLGAILITLLTVSFQAIKAALANPVKSLRTE